MKLNEDLLKQIREEREEIFNEKFYISKMSEEIIYRFWEKNKDIFNEYDTNNNEDLGIALEYIIWDYNNKVWNKKEEK